MDKVMQHQDLIKLLYKAKPALRKTILAHAPNSLIQALALCALNITNSRVPLKNCQFKNLCRHKHKIRQLSQKNISLNKKRKILQTGSGLLTALIAPILSGVLGSIIPSIGGR